MIITKVTQSSNSLIIVIPQSIVKEMDLKKQDYFAIEINAARQVTLTKVDVKPREVFLRGVRVNENKIEKIAEVENAIKAADEITSWRDREGK